MRIFVVIMMTVLFCFLVSEDIKADSEPFEKGYFKIGYKESYKALQDSEEHFKRTIALPTQLPPIPFTHNMGRFSDLEGNENDQLEIFFINKDLPQIHYLIRIQPIEYGLEIQDEQIDQKFKLEDGNEAIFTTTITLGFNLLVFQKKWLAI